MEKNIWEQLEEIAEDLGLCPDDTEERQTELENR